MKKKIYILDDNQSVCNAICFLFESMNFKTQIYQDPIRFLEEYSKEEKGCLIVDLFMPSLNGLELIKTLKQKNSALDIILISGYVSEETKKQVMNEGAKVFLPKPLNIEILLEEVCKILDK
ncbi:MULTISPECIES: response regulator transcription factor [Legionella]|uniref:Regulatory protein (GGDEF domain) n=1 Tax=Legionella maceachernii TaxID=466 RepID=A0A0W0VY00_9GAMM|nr:response regulator [Legionella maceachernii]KTD24897.1 regulatory protein (GGDEF domain) [Legionella maceachernii]SKA16095.1 Response regulator receiver domain-containing protein [Legionella maceachernii]SUP01599.1 Mycobacterial persistence regulator A [Legionella maceachernii]